MSVAGDNHQRCDPEAVPFLKRYSRTKDDLVERLFTLYNETVFDSKVSVYAAGILSKYA